MITKLIPVFAIAAIISFGAAESAFAGFPQPPPECENQIPPFGASQNDNPSTNQAVIYCEPFDLIDSEQTWYIGDSQNPQVVIADPNAGPWVKELAAPANGFPDSSPQFPFFDTLFEVIEVGPGHAWTDWHEEILTPDFTWTTDGQAFNPDGSPYTGNLVVDEEPTKVWVFFDPPLQPGSTLEIQKNIEYTGPATIQPLVVIQYPTFDVPVGGVGLPVDSVSLLLASASSMTLWMIPAIAAIGIGVFVIKRKF